MRIDRALVLGIVFSLFISGHACAESFVGAVLKDQHIATVQSYADWLAGQVTYRSDGGSREWADPKTTLQRGYGDCKDYALLNREALRHLGYQARIFSVTQFNQDKHAIVVFQVEGRYAFLSNDELYLTDARTQDEFQAYLASQHEYFSPTEIK
ncbi:MAG TPA: transglutaminase domain-containing protein [Candidatus Omnitrophota bacterium]|nr:transglutaminase domain-containing protein [Candidatus Omnitrophota bacterium]